MNNQPGVLRARSFWIGITALALATAAGAATLVLETPYAPLVVVALAMASVPGVMLLFRPVAAVFVLVFIKLLPPGLFPDELQSLLANLALLLALAAWLMQVVFGQRRIAMPLPVVLLASVILMHFISIAWAPDLSEARRELVQWTIVLLLMGLIVNLVDSQETLDGLMRVLALNAWVLVLAGVITVLTGGYEAGTRLKVLAMNENSYGTVLLLTSQGVLWGALRPGSASRWPKLLSLLFIPLAGILTVFTGSRGSLLSLGLTYGVCLLLRPTRRWGAYVALLGAIGVLASPGLFTSISNRLNNPEEDLLGDRTLLWQASLDLISDHPWGTGVGYGPYALHDYILRYTPSYSTRPDLPSHNPVLEVGIDTGLAGMLLYCALLGVAVWGFSAQFLRLRAAGDPRWNVYFALVGAITVGYATSWIKAGGVYFSESFILQLTLLALPACMSIFQPREPAQPTGGQLS